MQVHLAVYPEMMASEFWEKLSKDMAKEGGILQTRTSPEELRGTYENGLAVILMVDDEPAGYFAIWPMSEEYYEVGSGFIRKDLRSQGYGTALYKKIATLSVLDGKIAFAISKNPAAIKAGYRAGFIRHLDWKNPVPYEFTCGLCDWIEEDKKPMCPDRNSSCTLCILHGGGI
ncbi:GNAT family N-acetyltransferase [Candidatus Uhrbacteria bacterium]|nr:GNAT family N-acetyltransferase [Candidatus Uhrbacteria bacterium]